MINPRLLTRTEQFRILQSGTEEMLCEAQDAKTLKAVAELLHPHVDNEELEGLHHLLLKEAGVTEFL